MPIATEERQARKCRKELKHLTDQVKAFLVLVDREMKKPSASERGSVIAGLCNKLQMQNDMARRFTAAALSKAVSVAARDCFIEKISSGTQGIGTEPMPPYDFKSKEALDKANAALWPFAQLKLAEGDNGSMFFVTRGEIENAVEAFYATRAALVRD